MTTEEKAKAYDEAIEKIDRCLTDKYGCLLGIKPSDIFPQLSESESEDEKVRKILINIVKGACKKYGVKYIGDEVTEEKLLAYLDKQKEQNPVKLDDDTEVGIEQKPTAEWSEEKEKDIQEASEYLREYANNYVQGGNSKLYVQSLADRIESLRPQPKQKWSEEDETVFKCIKSILKDYASENYKGSKYCTNEQVKEWIKWFDTVFHSLHPQPHTASIKDVTKFGNLEYERGVKDGIQSEKSRQWKPSEEDLTALEYCAEHNCPELLSLYLELKKL